MVSQFLYILFNLKVKVGKHRTSLSSQFLISPAQLEQVPDATPLKDSPEE